MSQPRLLPAAYTVAWVSALPLESAAAAEMLDEKHCDPRSHGSNTDQYVFGQVGNHNVVMARLPSGQMGNNSAADVAGRLTTAFPSIKFALMVGIGGGVPTASADIRLGDVVVGHPHSQHGGVVQYDFGKTGPNGQVHRTGFINAPPKVLLNAIAKLRENHYRRLNDVPAHLSAFDRLAQFSRNTAGPDVLFQAAYKHSGGDDCESCNKEMIIERPRRESKEVIIHYGTIASGNQVMKDGVTRDRISVELGGVLCFEMEGAGLAGAFPSAVIRGICDYADSHKNKSWQPYAAATAAAFAKELLRVVPAEEIAKTNISGRISGTEKYRVSFSLKGIPRGRFADRPEEMRRLEQVLLPHRQVQSEDYRQQVVVLHGLGGIGKTQLAAEFARKHQAAFTSVFWLDGSSEDSLKQSIADYSGRIPEGQIPETSRKYSSSANGDLKAVINDFMEWLSKTENKHWLIIFDNVDRDYQQENDINAYSVSNYIPEVDHGLILITTRLANLQHLGETLQLETVDMSQAQAIFRKWYNQDFDPNDSNELLRLLDGLPLALAQAAAYMSETGASFSTYTRLYKERWKDLMEIENTAPLRNYGNRSINTTWTVSYNAIRAKDEAAANLLLLWAHLDHKTLPFWILQAGAHGSSALAKNLSAWLRDAAADEVGFLQVVRLLRSYCLIDSLRGSSTHGTHPVVHEWAFHIQDKHQRAELSRLAVLVIGYAVPDKHATEYHQKQRQLFAHAESCIERMERATADTMTEVNEEVSYALHMMGILLSDRGNLGKAEKMYQRALEGYEKAWGPDHTSTLDTVNNLGLLYADQGKLTDAEKMYQRALEGYEKAWGSNHTSTLDTVNNLGNLYKNQGKLADAEKMYQRALEGKEKAWGPDHTSTLDTVNNLGLLYADQGKLVDAEKMYQRALEGYEKAWGPDHTSILNTVNNLGLLYADQGKLEDAEKMYQRALEGKETAWGPDHTLTLDTVNNLGLLYADQGKLVDAEKMYQRALEGKEKAWGPDHTSTLDTVNNLGLLYTNQGKLTDAEKMYQRALEGYEKAWGPDHTSTLDTVNNLGLLYANQGKLVDAEKMYQQALEGKVKAWGPNHTSTLDTVNNLGNLYAGQGKLTDAEKMYQLALEGYEKALGPDHISTLGIVNNLGNLYVDQGKLTDAEKMYQRALEGKVKACGPDHTSTLDTVNNLGLLYADQGKLVDAEKMYQRALEGYEKAWGPDHTSTLDTVNNLGLLYADQGKLEDAEKLYQRALEGYEKALGPDNILSYVPALNNAYSYGSPGAPQEPG
ncbi:hypothetical protein TMatcc_009589 [Talaromyces marneffei ATCC 18224]